MKNMIMYYYDFLNPKIYRWNNKIYVKYKNKKYLLQEIKNEKKVLEIYNVIKNDSKYHNFVRNKFNNLITIHRDKKYVLLRLNKEAYSLKDAVFNIEYISPNKRKLIKENWYFLWSRKNDYLEYQFEHVNGKYRIIDESIDYYIGMAETAISYIKYIENTKNINEITNLAICHKRIEKEELSNPINLMVDIKERDIGEYLKYIFYNETYDNEKIKETIRFCEINRLDCQKVYARVIYPSKYFDIYESVIKGDKKPEELKKIIKKVDKYESYLNKIYEYISKKIELKKIDWIKKSE